jgi:hypothetical protein
VKQCGGKTIRCFETKKLKMAQATGQQIITQATALALADGNTFSSLGVAEQMLYIHLAQQAMPTLQTTSAGGSILKR